MSLYLGDKLISGIGQDRIADTLPIGAIIEWDSDLIPENWLLLNGQAVSRTVYSELFAIYGTTYGAGDGSTTFNLPDRRTRVAVGRDANDEDFAALGITGGEKEHTLTIDELATHDHKFQRQQWYSADTAVSTNTGAIYSWKTTTGGSTSQAYKGGDSVYAPVGGSQPHNNLQPYIVTNFIVKAKLYTTEFIGGNMVIDNLTSDSSVNVLSARMGKELHEEVRPIEHGGTGANEAEKGLLNLGGMKMVKLWQNASPGTTFDNQTITIDMAGYDLILIQFILDSNGRQLPAFITETTRACYYNIAGYNRHFSVYTDKISFTDYSHIDCVKPFIIYGIKGVL